MPTIELSKKELEKYIGKKVDVETLKDRISLLGTDLEGIDGDIINVEVFPNRPDLLSQPGFSRAVGHFIGAIKKPKTYVAKNSDYLVKVDKSVDKIRPFTACAVVKGLKFFFIAITLLLLVFAFYLCVSKMKMRYSRLKMQE